MLCATVSPGAVWPRHSALPAEPGQGQPGGGGARGTWARLRRLPGLTRLTPHPGGQCHSCPSGLPS